MSRSGSHYEPNGAAWNEPVAGTGNIDCVATSATGAMVEPLRIQVVKANY